MPSLLSEDERIRRSIENIDYQLSSSSDMGVALRTASEWFYRESLQVAHEQVVSQARTQELLSKNTGELLETLQAGLEGVVDSIEGLGACFEWGFDEILCGLEMQRKELREILRTLQAPLGTQAKELRKRGFEALSNGWYKEALTDLLASEEKNYCDFTVLHAIATIYVRDHKWNDARRYYAKAAKYAWPYSSRDASEACLGASVSYRQLKNYPAAYHYTKNALGLTPSSLQAHYQHAINAVLVAQSEIPPASRDHITDALTHLRLVVKNDEMFSVRVDTEPYFNPIRSECNELLENLRKTLQQEAEMRINEVDRSIERTKTYCTDSRFRKLGRELRQKRTRIQELHDRASILDFVEIRRLAPEIQAESDRIYKLTLEMDQRMESLSRAYQSALLTVEDKMPKRLSPQLENDWALACKERDGVSRESYERLLNIAPRIEGGLYEFAKEQLLSAQNRIEKALRNL